MLGMVGLVFLAWTGPISLIVKQDIFQTTFTDLRSDEHLIVTIFSKVFLLKANVQDLYKERLRTQLHKGQLYGKLSQSSRQTTAWDAWLGTTIVRRMLKKAPSFVVR